jgi:hypothetical protein
VNKEVKTRSNVPELRVDALRREKQQINLRFARELG